jgi:hypothetical protein
VCRSPPYTAQRRHTAGVEGAQNLPCAVRRRTPQGMDVQTCRQQRCVGEAMGHRLVCVSPLPVACSVRCRVGGSLLFLWPVLQPFPTVQQAGRSCWLFVRAQQPLPQGKRRESEVEGRTQGGGTLDALDGLCAPLPLTYAGRRPLFSGRMNGKTRKRRGKKQIGSGDWNSSRTRGTGKEGQAAAPGGILSDTSNSPHSHQRRGSSIRSADVAWTWPIELLHRCDELKSFLLAHWPPLATNRWSRRSHRTEWRFTLLPRRVQHVLILAPGRSTGG